jgi:hypothetical protein
MKKSRYSETQIGQHHHSSYQRYLQHHDLYPSQGQPLGPHHKHLPQAAPRTRLFAG